MMEDYAHIKDDSRYAFEEAARNVAAVSYAGMHIIPPFTQSYIPLTMSLCQLE